MTVRRGNGEGSIYFHEGRNRYEGQYFYTDPVTGERKRKKLVGKSKATIAKRAKEFIEKMGQARKEFLAAQSQTENVEQWLYEWLERFIRPGVRIKTYERYQCSITQHIVPYIGNIGIDQLSAEDVQKMLHDLLTEGGERHQGLSARTVNTARRTLKTALDKAVHLRKIAYNPVEATKACRTEKPTIMVISHEDAQRLLFVAKNEDRVAYMAILLALSTGMRLGEIFGLLWANIDLDGKRLYVKQTLVATSHGYHVEMSPKTKTGCRQIDLPKHCLEELQDHQKWLERRKEEWMDKYEEHDLVICNDNGSYKDPSYFSYKIFKRLLAKTGIPPNVRFHDLRHTHATWLLEKGVHPKVVAERLGHSSIRITLDTYSHVIKGMQQVAVDKLDEIEDSW